MDKSLAIIGAGKRANGSATIFQEKITTMYHSMIRKVFFRYKFRFKG